MRYTSIVLLGMVILSPLTSASSYFDQEEGYYDAWKRFKLSMGRDENGSIKPDLTIAHYWNENFYTEITISQLNDSKVDQLDSFETSKRSTSYEEQDLALKLLGYEWEVLDDFTNGSMSAALQYDYNEIKRTEFGYVHLTIPSVIDDWVAFDNEVKLITNRASLAFDTFLSEKDRYQIKAYGNYTLYNSLDVDQKVEFRPLVDSIGQASSSTEQKNAIEFGLLAQYMLIDKLGLGFSYRNLERHFEYDASVVASTADQFEKTTIKTDETIEQFEFLLFVGNFSKELRPSINYSRISTRSKNEGIGEAETTPLTVVSLGLNGVF